MGCKSSKTGCLPVTFSKKKNRVGDFDIMDIHLVREEKTVSKILSTASYYFLSTTKPYVTATPASVEFQMVKQLKVMDTTSVVDVVKKDKPDHDDTRVNSDNENSSAYGDSEHTEDELHFGNDDDEGSTKSVAADDLVTDIPRAICKSRLINVKPLSSNDPRAVQSVISDTDESVGSELLSKSDTSLTHLPRIIRVRPKAAKGYRVGDDGTATPIAIHIKDFESNVQKLVDNILLEPLKMNTRDVRFRPKAARGKRTLCMPLNPREGMVMPTYSRHNTRFIRPHLTVKGFSTPQDDCLSAWIERQEIKDTFGNG